MSFGNRAEGRLTEENNFMIGALVCCYLSDSSCHLKLYLSCLLVKMGCSASTLPKKPVVKKSVDVAPKVLPRGRSPTGRMIGVQLPSFKTSKKKIQLAGFDTAIITSPVIDHNSTYESESRRSSDITMADDMLGERLSEASLSLCSTDTGLPRSRRLTP